ncbi:MAG: hypothetical protein KDJ52_15785 [Anaerolineae bacterium]|nr:hypothetical protein [Anaerolineae bacterium]
MRKQTNKERREETLEQVGILLEQNDTDALLLTSTQMMCQIIEKFVGRICNDIQYTNFSVDIIMRCVAQKTYETLLAIVELAKLDKGYSAMPLLRPMCEELIFISFIKTPAENLMIQYMQDKVILEILQGFKAQNEFFPRAAQLLSLEDYSQPEPERRTMDELESRILDQKNKLKELGKKIGWGNRPAPTVKYMAEATNNLMVYDFFYHASSSAVHASLHHLGRMVWGNPSTGVFSITNKHFKQYYHRFVLTYGSWLASQVVSIVQAQFPDDWPKEEKDSWSILLALFIVPAIHHQAPKIITKEELRWSK